jgi:hypothetical protein
MFYACMGMCRRKASDRVRIEALEEQLIDNFRVYTWSKEEEEDGLDSSKSREAVDDDPVEYYYNNNNNSGSNNRTENDNIITDEKDEILLHFTGNWSSKRFLPGLVRQWPPKELSFDFLLLDYWYIPSSAYAEKYLSKGLFETTIPTVAQLYGITTMFIMSDKCGIAMKHLAKFKNSYEI